MKKEKIPNKKFYQKNLLVDSDNLLLNFLLKTFSDKSRNEVKSYLAHRQILVNGKCATSFDFTLKKGDSVAFLSIGEGKPNPNHKCKILFEDEDIIVVDKKYGVLSMSTGKADEQTVFSVMTEHVRRRGKNNRVFIVHRLDRETSGLLLLAKNFEAQQILQMNWNENTVERTYIAVVEGEVTKPSGQIMSYLTESPKSLKMHASNRDNGGKKAITNYKTLKSGTKYSLLEVSLETGRKNQIRVQLASIGHPVAGDKKYGAKTNPLKRICLHAQTLSFYHPKTHKKMKFSTDIPKEFL